MTYGNCKDCIFWRNHDGDHQATEHFKRGGPGDIIPHWTAWCHARAPQIIVRTNVVNPGTDNEATVTYPETVWPTTRADGGCGDFNRAMNAENHFYR